MNWVWDPIRDCDRKWERVAKFHATPSAHSLRAEREFIFHSIIKQIFQIVKLIQINIGPFYRVSNVYVFSGGHSGYFIQSFLFQFFTHVGNPQYQTIFFCNVFSDGQVVAELTPPGGWSNSDGLQIVQKPQIESLVRNEIDRLGGQGMFSLDVAQILFVQDSSADIAKLDHTGIRKKVSLDTNSILLETSAAASGSSSSCFSKERIDSAPTRSRAAGADAGAPSLSLLSPLAESCSPSPNGKKSLKSIALSSVSRLVQVDSEDAQSAPDDELSSASRSFVSPQPVTVQQHHQYQLQNASEIEWVQEGDDDGKVVLNRSSKPTCSALKETAASSSQDCGGVDGGSVVGHRRISKPVLYWRTYVAELWQHLLGN